MSTSHLRFRLSSGSAAILILVPLISLDLDDNPAKRGTSQQTADPIVLSTFDIFIEPDHVPHLEVIDLCNLTWRLILSRSVPPKLNGEHNDESQSSSESHSSLGKSWLLDGWYLELCSCPEPRPRDKLRVHLFVQKH